MRKALLVIFCFVVLSAFGPVGAQTASPEAASSPQASAIPAAPPELLSQDESFGLVNRLNEATKLFPESYIWGSGQFKVLKPENCFGVRLANGQRLVGESSGQSYGLRGARISAAGKEEYVVIGVLYAEFPFSIDNRPLPAGPYVVHAYKDALELWGNDEKETRYDRNRRMDVPLAKEEKLPLKAALPDALLAEKATEIPRFTLAIENGSLVLSLHGNAWKLVPR